jgi:8-oxo-dGTP pyrophosphatase MutT (NUDIX family)
MSLQSGTRLLTSGDFQREQLEVEVLAGSVEYSVPLQIEIDRIWNDVTRSHKRFLFDGQIASLLDYKVTNKKLKLILQQTSYKNFYVLDVLQGFTLNPPVRTNALAICAVTVTSDNMVIVGKRNRHLAEGSGSWHVPAGTLDHRVLEGMHPFDLIEDELKEEFNIQDNEISEITCIGLGINDGYNKPEILTRILLKSGSEKIRSKMDKAIDFGEHSEVRFIPLKELQTFIDQHPITPIGRLCIDQFLKA